MKIVLNNNYLFIYCARNGLFFGSIEANFDKKKYYEIILKKNQLNYIALFMCIVQKSIETRCINRILLYIKIV